MKKLNVFFLGILMVLLAVSAQAEDKQILNSESFMFQPVGEELTANKFFLKDEVCIEIVDKAGKKLLEKPGLGSEDKKFSVMGQLSGLAVVDLTGDNVPEVLASAFYGPASALYIFKFDEQSKKFVSVKFADNPDPELHRDFMVSDLPMSQGNDIMVLQDLSLKALGKIYPANPDEEVKAGEYFYKWADGVFKLVETKVLEGK